MKKKLFAIFLALTMIFSLTGCGTDSSADVAALEEKIDALTQQVETLSGRLDMLEQKSGLQSWALIPTARKSLTLPAPGTAPAILPLLSWKPQTATATSAVFLPLMAPGNSSP